MTEEQVQQTPEEVLHGLSKLVEELVVLIDERKTVLVNTVSVLRREMWNEMHEMSHLLKRESGKPFKNENILKLWGESETHENALLQLHNSLSSSQKKLDLVRSRVRSIPFQPPQDALLTIEE